MPIDRHLTRITLVDRHELFAEALDVALTLVGHQVQRVAACEQGLPTARLVEAVQRSRPRVVMLDPDLEDCDGARVIRPLAESGVIVVVLSADVDPARWGEWLWLGAHTVMSKSVSLNGILATLRAIGEGRGALPLEARNRFVADYHRERRESLACRAQLEALTHREREVLSHLIHGDTVRDIARADCVSEATVRTQIKSILGKLEVTSQLAAVSVAYRAQWRPPHPMPTGRPVYPVAQPA